MKHLKSKTIHNLAFFGGQREGVLSINGHYKIITDGFDFIVIKIGDYGTNFTSFPSCNEIAILQDNDYRVIHDILLKYDIVSFSKATKDEETLFENNTKYNLKQHRISNNIVFGDEVIDLETNETFIVNDNHNISYINRNYHYKLTQRGIHPQPLSLEKLILKMESVNPFNKWEKVDSIPNRKSNITDKYIINDLTYIVVYNYDYNQFYIKTPTKEIYLIKSHVSSPLYDTLELICGVAYMEYNSGSPVYYTYKDVIHIPDQSRSFIKASTKFAKITETENYRFNTRETYL